MNEILLRRGYNLLTELQGVAAQEAYRDTTVVCSDGTTQCSWLVAGLVLPDLYQTCPSAQPDCTLILPDLSISEFREAADFFHSGGYEKRAQSPHHLELTEEGRSSQDDSQEVSGEAVLPEHQRKKADNWAASGPPGQLSKNRETPSQPVLADQKMCEECNYQAPDSNTLRSHVKSRHQGALFTCGECDFTARWERSVKRHTAAVHRGNRNSFLCHLCHYATSQHASLRRHIRVMHAEDRLPPQEANFQCELCSFRARWSRSIRRHRLAVHEQSGERAHACSECLYRAGQASTLRRHQRLVHGRREKTEPDSAGSRSHPLDAVELAIAYSDIRL